MNTGLGDNGETSPAVQAQLIVLSARLDVMAALLSVIHAEHRIGAAESSRSVEEYLRQETAQRIEHYLATLADHDHRLASELSTLLASLKRDLNQ